MDRKMYQICIFFISDACSAYAVRCILCVISIILHNKMKLGHKFTIKSCTFRCNICIHISSTLKEICILKFRNCHFFLVKYIKYISYYQYFANQLHQILFNLNLRRCKRFV